MTKSKELMISPQEKQIKNKFCIEDYEKLTFIEICNKYISSKITLDDRFLLENVMLEEVYIEGYGNNYEITVGFEFEDEYIEIKDNDITDIESVQKSYDFEYCCNLWEQSPLSLIPFFNEKVNKLVECDINYKKEIRENKDKGRGR